MGENLIYASTSTATSTATSIAARTTESTAELSRTVEEWETWLRSNVGWVRVEEDAYTPTAWRIEPGAHIGEWTICDDLTDVLNDKPSGEPADEIVIE